MKKFTKLLQKFAIVVLLLTIAFVMYLLNRQGEQYEMTLKG